MLLCSPGGPGSAGQLRRHHPDRQSGQARFLADGPFMEMEIFTDAATGACALGAAAAR